MNPKNKFRFRLTGLILVICILGLLAAIATPARAQVNQPNFIRSDTNAFPLLLTNGAAKTFTAGGTNSYKLTLKQNTGLSVFVTVISSNPAAGNVGLGWDLAGDTNTITTTQPLKFLVPAAAATTGTLCTNVYWTNWPASVLSNVRYLQLTTATNALVGGGPTTNSVSLQLKYSYSSQ